jgi:DNA primase
MAGLVPDSLREQIRAASDIVEVISGYIPLKKSAGAFVALCPFHKEKSPSFHVNPQKQFFHCFGCHKSGDVFAFVQQYENIGFMETLRRLAERARIPLQFESRPGQEQALHLKETLLILHEQITQRWQAALATEPAGAVARDYLAKRRVSAEAVKLFRLGYAPDQWDDTVNWARAKGRDPALVEQAGLIVRKPETGSYYDRFRGRLMFPICDEQGRVIGFSGRILQAEQSPAKYINSPETPLFTKGRVIYGLDKSKRDVLEKKSAVVCEGQLDLISCFLAGVRNVVAPQGTAFTPDQVRILKRYADEVVLCFDSDPAGQNAAIRSLDSLLAAGLAIRVASVPAPHDPDSFIKEFGGPAFQNLIDEAGSFFDFFLELLCQKHDVSSDKGRTAVVRQMGENLAKAANLVLTDTYAQKTALRIGVAVDSVRAEFRKSSPGSARESPEDVESPAQPSITRPPELEAWFLKLLILSDEHLEWIAARLDPEWLTHPVVRDLAQKWLQLHSEHPGQGFGAWLGGFQDPALQSFLAETAMQQRPLKDLDQLIKGTGSKAGVLQLLRDQHLDRKITVLEQRANQPGLSEAETLALLLQKQALAGEKRKFME